jgi:hypothetical protein
MQYMPGNMESQISLQLVQMLKAALLTRLGQIAERLIRCVDISLMMFAVILQELSRERWFKRIVAETKVGKFIGSFLMPGSPGSVLLADDRCRMQSRIVGETPVGLDRATKPRHCVLRR